MVLHLHGGGYTMGSAELSVPLAARLARAAGGWALVPDYRLAPEHPFPAALDDVLAAYRWLAREYPRAPVIVSGECAGGGLALGLALALRDCGGRACRMQAGIHVVSPFCDLALRPEHPSLAVASDPWFNRIALVQLAACYLHDADPGQPLVSPVRGDLSGLPPLLIQAAADEALFCRPPRWPDGRVRPVSRSRSVRSPTACTRSSCSTSCRRPAERSRSSPRSRARCSRVSAGLRAAGEERVQPPSARR